MGSVTNKVSDMENKISGTEFKKQRKKNGLSENRDEQ